jgi:hypothetical protein
VSEDEEEKILERGVFVNFIIMIFNIGFDGGERVVEKREREGNEEGEDGKGDGEDQVVKPRKRKRNG